MNLALAVLGGTLVLAGCATGGPQAHRAAHHPPGSLAAAAAPAPDQLESMMRAMQEMHDRMTAAKTPEDRARLMQEHMKLMQDGMGMMGRMRGGPGGMGMGPSMSPDMMGRRMDMMEMMMQMMMDREAMKPAPAK